MLTGWSAQRMGDRHLAFPAHSPMSNLMPSLLVKPGVNRDRFGNSIGPREI